MTSSNTSVAQPLSHTKQRFIDALKAKFPSKHIFNRDELREAANSIGSKYPPAWVVTDKSRNVSRGMYMFVELFTASPSSTSSCLKMPNPQNALLTFSAPPSVIHTPNQDMNIAMMMAGVTGGDRTTIIPEVCKEYVPWGHFKDIELILRSNLFAPTYITGMSGNGKTTMVEQVCAKLKRECFRVNIVAETDEDDLLGGFRLIDGNTVWQNGPAVEAMIRGSVLLLDEIDLGTSKLMCLQPILEGKGIYLKKINKWISPAAGFTVFATANTKGKGSDDGRFIGTNIMNEAMLDRFDYTYEQEYAPRGTEKRILLRAMEKFSKLDIGSGSQQDIQNSEDSVNFAECLTKWAEMLRLSFAEGTIDELISTRRLVNITKAFYMFKNKEKAIKMSLARFDLETSESFFSAYTKIDAGMIPTKEEVTAENSASADSTEESNVG